MQSENLKPCPFCGGEAERVDIEDGENAGGSFVHCTVCDASGNIEFEFKENFISNWNRRVEAALSAAEPVSSRNDEAGYVEFLNEDVPYIVRDIQGAVAILMDLETRNVIGYRVYDPDSVFAPPAPSLAVKASPEALEQFTAYFVKNYPGPDTIIFDPKWHAPKIFRAAVSALSAQVQDVEDSPATKAIAAERARQIEVEAWTPEHDDAHAKGELLLAAKAYFAHATDRALSIPDGERAGIPFVWPWDKKWWKPKTPRKDLIRAGALALAEIERIKRLYHVRAEHRYIDAEAHYRLIVAELERLDSAAAPAKQEA